MTYIRKSSNLTSQQILEEQERVKLAHQQLKEDFLARDAQRSAPKKKTRKRARAGLR